METEKIGFFKRVLISIKDFEKYDIFAMEKWQSSIKYLFIITLIFSFIFTILYSYKILTGGLDDLINQIEVDIPEELNMSSSEMQEIVQQNYAVFFIVIFLSILTIYFFSTIINVVMLGILAFIVARIVGMRLKFQSSFNIGVYSLTLPIILQIIYLVINLLTGFEIKYFQWMYTTISYIYVVVAILMIKTQFINQQRELIRIQLEQQKIREEMQEQENEDKEEKKDDKEEKKEDEKEKEDSKDNNVGEAPEGTNA